jgi:tape measure domain-containing protein
MMPSIAANLALNDAFSQRLNQINGALASTMRLMESLNAHLQAQITLRISVFDAVSGLDAVKQQLAALSTTRDIQISVNTTQVLEQLRTIRQQFSTEASESIIHVRLDAADLATQAAALRRQIDAELDGIVALIRIELPASLTTMFTNLQRLVLRLIQATRQLRTRTGDAEDLRRALERIAALERQIADLQSRVNSQINNASKGTSNWMSSLKGLISAYLSLAAAKRLLSTADDMATTNARLAMVNDGLRTQVQLQQQVMDAANETRANYQATADLVTKLGMSTQGIFQTDDDILKFTKSFNKALVISGAGAQETTSAILQMGQALGSGVLQGDELRSLSESAPALMTILAEGLGVARGELKQMGAEGKLTSDVIVKAFEKQSDKIDKMFEQMPMTFGAATTIFKNKVSEWVATLNGVGGPMSKITQMVQDLTAWLSTDAGGEFLSGFSAGIATAVDLVVYFGQVIADVYNFISSNWPMISPIIMGIVTALALYKGAVMAISIWSGITTLAELISASAKATLTKATLEATSATAAQTAAQWGLNAALLANPITWVILVIIAVIAIIYIVVAAINKFAGTSLSATGIIVGAFAALGAFIWNTIVGVINAIIQYLWTAFVEPWISIIEWVLNVFNGGFNSFGDAVANLIGQIISWFLSLGKVVTKIIDAIFGTDWTAGLSSLQDSVLEWGKNEQAITLERAAPEIDSRIGYGDAYNAGYDWGSNLIGSGKNDGSEAIDALNKANAAYDFASAATPTPVVDKVKKVGKIEKPVDISKDDLKIMRDFAEMKNIQNFVTLTPTVQVKTGAVTNQANLDSIVTKITKKLNEEIASTAKGVYS